MKKLKTKNCCFLCLRKIKIEGHNENRESAFHLNRKNQNLLRCLIRHLKINLNGVGADSSTSNIPSQDDTDVEVDLCEDCVQLNNRFSKLFLQLEKIQMEMEFYLERIHHRLLESSKNAELVQNYSKEMTSDRETLSQLAFVDKLRKEIADKSPRLAGVNPTVNLTPIEPAKVITVKQEAEEIVDFEDTNHFEDHNLERCSPTPEDYPDQSYIEFSSELKPEVASEAQKLKMNYSKVNKYCSKNLSTGLYHCNICAKPLKRADTVRLHYDAIHLNKKFNCDGCSRPFSQYAGLQQHKKICNGVVTVKIQKRKVYYIRDSVTGMFQCTKCEKKSPTYSTIVLHYESIHLRKRYKCDICNNQVFKQLTSLGKHKKTCRELIEDCLIEKEDGEGIRIACKLCGKQFPSMMSFGVHRRVVHLKNDPGP